MPTWRRKIEFEEHESGIFAGPFKINDGSIAPKSKGDLEITAFKLLVGTAKSFLTHTHVWSPEAAAIARGYGEFVSFLINERNGYLAIDSMHDEMIRDFSKTARHGELAQGINYILAKEKLGAIAVYDFDYYKNEVVRLTAEYTGSKPDFVLVYPDRSIGILESKGTTKADPSGCMLSGHNQCENGKGYFIRNGVAVKNSYVSAVSFAASSNRRRVTKLYYADPEGNEEGSKANVRGAFLYEYAKFFYLAGNKRAYELLKAGETLKEEDMYAGFDANSEGIINEYEVNNHTIVLGINRDARDFLLGKSEQFDVMHNTNVEVGENYEMFADGTYLRITN